ncbi:DUF262 domain-containing protein [Mycolicibacterium sp. 3033]|nr:DUF262 domain-containing protein [Mycolicibacterium aurantiacum]
MADPRAMQKQLDDLRRKVDVDTYTITVRELLSMAEGRELHRAPTYQRKFRWDEETESRLIESLLLGLPVPNVFFATNEDGTWEVVDGLQRISTLIHFASKDKSQQQEIAKESPLRLKGLRMLTEFDNLTFEELPSPVQLAFTKRGIGVTALSDKSDPETRFDTFERLNRGAVALSDQEVRACLNEGPLNSLLRELATNPTFKQLIKLQEKDQNNATLEEQVLKFFAYKHDRAQFTGSVRDFLNEWMAENSKTTKIDALREDFERTVAAVWVAVGKQPFLRAKTSVTPKNELEAVLVAASEVLDEYGTLGTPAAGWPDDPQLTAASTAGTNTKGKLRDRIDRAKVLLTPAA